MDTEKNVPRVLGAVGALLIVLNALVYHPRTSPMGMLAAVCIMAAIGTAIMLVAALVTAILLRVSFGLLSTAIVKFAAIYIFVLAIASWVATLTGSGLLTLVAFAALTIGLTVWFFDMEKVYAIVFALIALATKIAVGVFLAALLT